MDIQVIAENLQKFVLQRFNRSVPILKSGSDEPAANANEPAILCSSWSGGDPYGGYTTVDELALVLPRRDSGAPLSVRFSYALHELSGQCDQWIVRLDGATPGDVEALSVVFSPTQNTNYWNPHIAPALFVDGEQRRSGLRPEPWSTDARRS